MRQHKLPWKNAKGMRCEIDKLPKTVKWQHKTISVPANADGTGVKPEVDIYFRDIVDLLQELFWEARLC
jgi:hypothetical protein